MSVDVPDGGATGGVIDDVLTRIARGLGIPDHDDCDAVAWAAPAARGREDADPRLAGDGAEPTASDAPDTDRGRQS